MKNVYNDGGQHLIGCVKVLMQDQGVSPEASATTLGCGVVGDV